MNLKNKFLEYILDLSFIEILIHKPYAQFTKMKLR